MSDRDKAYAARLREDQRRAAALAKRASRDPADHPAPTHLFGGSA